jgi:hypothetical protein
LSYIAIGTCTPITTRFNEPLEGDTMDKTFSNETDEFTSSAGNSLSQCDFSKREKREASVTAETKTPINEPEAKAEFKSRRLRRAYTVSRL